MNTLYRRYGKRTLYLALAAPALLLRAPLLATVALLMRHNLGAPFLFLQERSGLHGVPFAMIKLRTMTGARDACGSLLPDAQRLTPLGRLLRRASLHELPELWNVLRGTMGQLGRCFYERELSLRAGIDRFEACFERALQQRRGVLP